MIGYNLFSGELPKQLDPNLTRLEIQSNNFSGRIPSEIWSSKDIAVLDESNNGFSGDILVGLTAFSGILTLSLGRNRLSGKFPSNIISWKSLTNLGLENKLISGEIASAIGLLPNLNALNLSGNQLSR
ncbi:hypothetical protein GIB67_010218 [Kingdonia uniflora]|uniref:Uncharacterized protein n=1 Tax=Kingdonia uniflora TaxID=39325 RepID=A0A7J7NBM0_9MAGN|nr:hypothetical protein GIB67_010218 [Kingdonia uniflora]